MSSHPASNATWYLDPHGRFRMALPWGWTVSEGEDGETFWLQADPPGPGDVRFTLLEADAGSEETDARAVVRASATSHPGATYVESHGHGIARYSDRGVSAKGDEYVYYWEVGAAHWVALWSYCVLAQLYAVPEVRREFALVEYVIGTFAFNPA